MSNYALGLITHKLRTTWLRGTVVLVRATRAGRLVSIPGQVYRILEKQSLRSAQPRARR